MADASLGTAFTQTQVQDLPLDGRNVPELLSLQAGVVFTGNTLSTSLAAYKDQDTRNGSVNGARSDQSNITLDGVDVKDQNSGYAFTSVLPITQDSVQEFRVTTSNCNADEGTGSGAQVALVTRSGSNAWHGSAYEYLRNTITSANDYLTKRAQIDSCTMSGIPLGDKQCNQPLKLIRNVFGGTIGGPIVKNRLFFFFNYEGTRLREEQSVVRRSAPPPLPFRGSAGPPTQLSRVFFAMSPQQISALDPLKNPGGTPKYPLTLQSYMIKYFQSTYGNLVTNDSSVGDGYILTHRVWFQHPTS